MISKVDSRIENLKKKGGICVPHRRQSGSIFNFSSSFLLNIGIVRYFNTVNTSDTVESGYTRIQHVSINTSDTVESRHTQTRHVSSLGKRFARSCLQHQQSNFQTWSYYISIDLWRDRKRSLKFREMLETQEYARAQDAEKRRQTEAQQCHVFLAWVPSANCTI